MKVSLNMIDNLSLISDHDVVCVLPTGNGTSLLFHLFNKSKHWIRSRKCCSKQVYCLQVRSWVKLGIGRYLLFRDYIFCLPVTLDTISVKSPPSMVGAEGQILSSRWVENALPSGSSM